MDHTASSTMDPFCTRLTNRIEGGFGKKEEIPFFII